MLTRILYKDGKVYYRVKDLKEEYSLSDYKMRKIIKVSEVETVKLEGFGKTKFIKEEDMNMLEINGGTILMRTEYKDFQQSYETNKSMDNFFNFLFNDRVPEKTSEELFNKTMQELDNFNKSNKSNKSDEDDKNNKFTLFNELCEKYGYSERVVSLKFISKNEYFELPLIINGTGNIVDSTTALQYCYCSDHLEYLKKDISNGVITNDEGEEELTLTKGNPFKIPTYDYLYKKIFELLRKNEIRRDCIDWIDVLLDNGCYVGIDIDMLIALMTDNISIIVNDNGFNENDIIDIDYDEIEL